MHAGRIDELLSELSYEAFELDADLVTRLQEVRASAVASRKTDTETHKRSRI